MDFCDRHRREEGTPTNASIWKKAKKKGQSEESCNEQERQRGTYEEALHMPAESCPNPAHGPRGLRACLAQTDLKHAQFPPSGGGIAGGGARHVG